MAISEIEIKKIIKFVKQEPRTVQEISKHIGRSWVTTDTYVKHIKETTGQINIKGFREGTKGALKIAYYNYAESLVSDEVRENLYNQIRNGREKTDFDFMEIFQFIKSSKKKSHLQEYNDEEEVKNYLIVSNLQRAEKTVYFFSGNLSFINRKEKGVPILDVLHELVKRKVTIKILCRVNIASLTNLTKLAPIIKKYPDFIEIKHCYQPLRGVIIDDKLARFKNEEQLKKYKKGELHKNTRIFYEIYDEEWIAWLEKVFWNLFRFSIDYEKRIQEIKKIF